MKKTNINSVWCSSFVVYAMVMKNLDRINCRNQWTHLEFSFRVKKLRVQVEITTVFMFQKFWYHTLNTFFPAYFAIHHFSMFNIHYWLVFTLCVILTQINRSLISSPKRAAWEVVGTTRLNLREIDTPLDINDSGDSVTLQKFQTWLYFHSW